MKRSFSCLKQTFWWQKNVVFLYFLFRGETRTVRISCPHLDCVNLQQKRCCFLSAWKFGCFGSQKLTRAAFWTLDTWKVKMQPFPYGNTYWSKNPWVSFIPWPSPSTKWFQYRTCSIDLTETTLQLHQIRSTCLHFAWGWGSIVVTPLPTKTCCEILGVVGQRQSIRIEPAYVKDLRRSIRFVKVSREV